MRLDQNAVLSLPNTGVSLALDLGDNGRVPFTPRSPRHGGVHPRCFRSAMIACAASCLLKACFLFEQHRVWCRNKTEVARRMALAYASTGLGHTDVVATGPVFTSATVAASGTTVTVEFGSAAGGIAMSPTSQCHLAQVSTWEGHVWPSLPRPVNASTVDCCSAIPRGHMKGNATLTSDGGVPFELLDSRTVRPAAVPCLQLLQRRHVEALAIITLARR